MLKASASRNFRFPTLNDLYFLPGGNPDLKRESGWTYDIGASFATGKEDVYSWSGSINWFDSHVKDWILWLPTTKGFFSPKNIKDVHAYGIELQSDFSVALKKDMQLSLNGTVLDTFHQRRRTDVTSRPIRWKTIAIRTGMVIKHNRTIVVEEMVTSL